MADNVAITAGAGTDVATDQLAGGEHVQKVKLLDGTADSATAILAGGGVEAGALRVTLASDSTGLVSVDDNGGALTVDGTVTAELSATDNAVLDAIAAAVATEGDALGDGVLMQGDDGTDRTNVLVDAAGHLQVDVLTAPAVRALTNADVVTAELSATDNAVLDAIAASLALLDNSISAGNELQVDVVTAPAVRALTNADVVTAELSATDNAVLDAAVTALQVIDNMIAGSEAQVDIVTGPTGAASLAVQGTVAHDSAAANNPVLLAGVARAAPQTAVAAADVAMLVTDLNGRLVVAPYTMPEKEEHYTSAADITDTADDEVFAAVASTSHYITHFSAMCSHATVGTYVVLKDNDTVIYSGYCAPAGGGFVATFPVPMKCASGVHVNVANVTNGSATRVNVCGFQAP
jgi:hypothetical protein